MSACTAPLCLLQKLGRDREVQLLQWPELHLQTQDLRDATKERARRCPREASWLPGAETAGMGLFFSSWPWLAPSRRGVGSISATHNGAVSAWFFQVRASGKPPTKAGRPAERRLRPARCTCCTNFLTWAGKRSSRTPEETQPCLLAPDRNPKVEDAQKSVVMYEGKNDTAQHCMQLHAVDSRMFDRQ